MIVPSTAISPSLWATTRRQSATDWTSPRAARVVMVADPRWYEPELTLQFVQPPLAEESARPDRDPRLQQVVAGAERVLVGVEEDLEASSLA